jgi:type I restriction enzyme S subunit
MKRWEKAKLHTLVSLKTGKLDSNAAENGGKYPFFTCSPETLAINSYAFDTTAILLAGNNATGVFPVKYYSGKFNAYQRTYVIDNVNKTECDLKFIFFALQMQLAYLQGLSIGAATKFLTKKILDDLLIPLPDLAIQRKIAAILSAYDDLIENNLQRIKLLEEMAQITYEEWFVRMKFPGHETAQWDKETGLPEGWREQNLSDFISIKHGFAYKGEYFTDSETSRVLLTPGNFKIGGGLKSDKFKFYENSAESPNEYVLKKHDLLITMTDLSKMADTLGYPLLVPSSSDKVYLHNQRLGKVLPCKNKLFPTYFYYMFFKNENYRGFVVGSASGATVKHTSPSKILAFKPKLSPLDGELVFQFDELVKPMFEVIDGLQRQNELLREAREILLPRLMTGVIDVDQVEVPEALLARVG